MAEQNFSIARVYNINISLTYEWAEWFSENTWDLINLLKYELDEARQIHPYLAAVAQVEVMIPARLPDDMVEELQAVVQWGKVYLTSTSML